MKNYTFLNKTLCLLLPFLLFLGVGIGKIWGQTTLTPSNPTNPCINADRNCNGTGENANYYEGATTSPSLSGFKLESTGVSGNQVTFRLSKCDGTALSNANGGWFNVRRLICTDPLNTSWNQSEIPLVMGQSQWNFTVIFNAGFTSGSTTVICAIGIGAPSSNAYYTSTPGTYNVTLYHTKPVTVTATTSACAPTVSLTSPSNGTSITSGSPITLNWSSNVGSGCSITGYELEITSSAGTAPTAVTGTSRSFTSVTQSFSWRVRAKTGVSSWGAWSSSWNVSVGSGGGGSPPSAPNISTIAFASDGIEVSWASVSGATGYDIYRNGIYVGNSANSPYADNGLTASINYCYTAKACNANGCSIASNQSCKTTLSGGGSSSTLLVNQNTMNFPASGLPDGLVVVTSNTSWTVTVDGNPAWIGGLGWGGTGNNQFSVELTPNANITPRTATMRVKTTDNAVEKTITIVQEGATPAPTRIISLSPTSLSFGNVTVGQTSAPQTITISNTGNSPLNVSNISFPSGFSGNWSSGTISASGSQNVVVTFSPTSATSYSGTVTINSDATSGSGDFGVSGDGVWSYSPPTVVAPANNAKYSSIPNGITFVWLTNGNPSHTTYRIRLNKNNGASIIERDILSNGTTITIPQSDLIENGTGQLGLKEGDYVNWRVWIKDSGNPTNDQNYTSVVSKFSITSDICYRLPFETGTSHVCTQGNASTGSHQDFPSYDSKYAFDFGTPIGTNVVASRSGIVERVVKEYENGNCLYTGQNTIPPCAKNVNLVVIKHGDNTFGFYLHLSKDVYVVKGDKVSQGQLIAKSGNSGWSSGAHLHFQVHTTNSLSKGSSIPISFQDVPSNGGIPIKNGIYTAGDNCDSSPLNIILASVSPSNGLAEVTPFNFGMNVSGGNGEPIQAFVDFQDYGNSVIPMIAGANNAFTLSKILQVGGNRCFRYRVVQKGSLTTYSQTLCINVGYTCASIPPPPIQNRSSWCPDGKCPTNFYKQAHKITHIIVHHSATTHASNTNWASVVRSFYNSHVGKKPTWGDIGYHYVIAPNGVIYEGRPENIRGCHTGDSKGNEGTLGICLIGNFSNEVPTEEAKESLVKLLSWLCSKYNINPTQASTHKPSNTTKNNIEGHRIYARVTGGTSTPCPGNTFYANFQQITSNVIFCANGTHNIAQAKNYVFNPVGSTISGTSVKLVRNGILYDLGVTAYNGSNLLTANNPIITGDSLFTNPSGYESVFYPIDEMVLNSGHFIVPMLKSNSLNQKVENPSIQILNEYVVTSNTSVTIKLSGSNIIKRQVETNTGWQDVGEIFTWNLSKNVEPLSEEEDDGGEGLGNTNIIQVRLMSAVDTVLLVANIDWFPANEFADNTTETILNFGSYYENADIFVNGIFYKKATNSNTTIKMPIGENEIKIRKFGYKDKNYISEGNETINVVLESYSLASSDALTFDFLSNDKTQSWRSMTYQDTQKKSIMGIKRYNKDWTTQSLKPVTETFEINKIGGQNSTLRGAVVFDQPKTPKTDSIYILEAKGTILQKRFLANNTHLFKYEDKSQKLEFLAMPTLPILSYTLMQTQAPIVIPDVQFEIARGTIKKIHINQIFGDPDFIPNDLTFVSVTGNLTQLNYQIIGDSLQVRSVDCFEGNSDLTVIGSHDGIQKTNTVRIIVKPMTITSTQVNVLCFGKSTGSINITIDGFVMPCTYQWSNGLQTKDIANLPIGAYTITITDATNCSKQKTITITQPPKMSATADITDIRCFNENNGEINFKPQGGTQPYTYRWWKGNNTTTTIATTEDLLSLSDGAYGVEVIDANGCKEIFEGYLVKRPDVLVATATPKHVSCLEASDGGVNMTITGGKMPYTYTWSNGLSTQNISGLLPTNAVPLKVMVKDANNCFVEVFVDINLLPKPTATIATTPVCFGESSVLKFTYNGTVKPYRIIYTNGTQNFTINNLTEPTHEVIINNPVNGTKYTLQEVSFAGNNVCKAEVNGEAKIVVWDLPIVNEVKVRPENCGNKNGIITITPPISGQNPFLYSLDNNIFQASPIFDSLSKGDYTLYIKDFNTCGYTYSQTISIKEINCPLVNIPNLITPNGDGKNDTWEPEVLLYYKQCIVKIEDRVGRVVYTSEAGYYPNVWDGGNLPIDTYYYTIDLRDGSSPYKGFITLVR